MSSLKKLTTIFLISAFLVVVTTGSYFFIRRVFFQPPVDAHIEYPEKKSLSDKAPARDQRTPVIQVNILNSTLRQGVAKQVMDYLRLRGFDVVEIGNSSDECEYSHVIDRVNDKSSAKKVAYAMGIDSLRITRKIDSTLFLQSTIVIGKDYQKLKPFL